MGTQNSWNNQIAAANSAITLNSGTNAVNISTDAAATTLSIGTGGAVKGLTLGSTNSTSASTLQSGSGALNVTATGGALTINSGTGTIGISTDASATTCNFATGGAVKTVQLGTTNTTSATVIKSGSGNIALNSGLTVDSSGRMYNTVQPAFSVVPNDQANVTGDGTTYTITWTNATCFDQNSNFSSPNFTAPITGKYLISTSIHPMGTLAANLYISTLIVTTAKTYLYSNLGGTLGSTLTNTMTQVCNMTAGDTVNIQFVSSGGTKVVGVYGAASWFSGCLIC